jgi:hypothetical protein
VLRFDSLLVEEKGSADETLTEKIGRENRKPFKQVETSARLEYEERNCLLHEQANYDSAPFDVRSVP